MSNIKYREIPFSGKLITAEPATIGTNFQTLKNLRYTDTHLKGIQGMTKINVAAKVHTTCYLTRNAFHFSKSQPLETHLLIQAYNAALASSLIVENMTAIPNAGEFSTTGLWTDSAGAGRGYFCEAPDGQMAYANGVDTCMWGGIETKIGAVIATTVALTTAGSETKSPKDYTDQMKNTKTDAANLMTISDTYLTFLVGSARPAKGAKIYMASVNAAANTLVVKESTATVWATIGVTSDGTRVAGVTFAATSGTISWPSTLATTKPKYLNGYYLYWYQFTVDACTATISHITLDCEFQPVIDIWDGTYRDIARFYKWTGSQIDFTLNVLKDDYDAASASTYVDVSELAVDQYLEAGFMEKQTGLYFMVPPEYRNVVASVVSIAFWDGVQYSTVGNISDGTVSVPTRTLSRSGVMSWNNTNIANERKLQYANAEPLYYYQVSFSASLSNYVRINYIGGINASREIGCYKFPIFAQGRILLCCDMSEEKNKAVASAKFMPQVYNGDDSVDIYFGEEGELTCGTELFSQFGSSLYALVLMFKDNETWVMAGQDITTWQDNIFLLSSSIGCPAPLTLKTINLAAEPGTGINRSLAIWQGANGVYLSDGRAPIPIHGDIKEYFDKGDARCIKASMVGDSGGWVDPERQEYHLSLASGTAATTLNTELVYDIHRNKWFEIDRTVDLQCGAFVHDIYGNSYNYGFLDTGYMERLENGTDFDGNDIVHTVHTGDFALAELLTETRISDFRLFCVAKTEVTDITMTHYGDTSATGTDVTLSHINTGYRIAQPEFTEKFAGDPFHSIKLTITTDNEAVGFEPIGIGLLYEPMAVY